MSFHKNRVDLNLINMQSKYAPLDLIEKSEKAFKKQIEIIVQNINNSPSIKVVLIAGPSSAGKTTSAKFIKEELIRTNKGAEVISMDNFFINRDITPILEDGTYDFENINTVDIPYFKNFIEQILTQKKAEMPIFNFYTGMREKEYINIELVGNSILIIEGIHALNPLILSNHEEEIYRVFVNPNTEYYIDDTLIIELRELRRIRRIIRDYYMRGIKPSETIKNWENVVRGEKKFIFPYKVNADFILDTTHYYEPLIYKKYLPSLLAQDDQTEFVQINEDLSHFEEMDIELVPKNSLLMEFLQGIVSLKNK